MHDCSVVELLPRVLLSQLSAPHSDAGGDVGPSCRHPTKGFPIPQSTAALCWEQCPAHCAALILRGRSLKQICSAFILQQPSWALLKPPWHAAVLQGCHQTTGTRHWQRPSCHHLVSVLETP